MLLNNAPDCRLVIFSDLHYASEKPVANGSIIERKLMQYALPLVDKLNEEILGLKPDVVINLGDLIEDSGNHDKDISDFTFIWDKLKHIPALFYSLVGNHDLRSMSSRKEIEQIMGYKNATFAININGYHLVFLGLEVKNKTTNEEGGILRTQSVAPEDITWLENDLKSNTLPVVIFNHFGLAEDNMVGNWWFEKCPENALLANRNIIKKILSADKNIIAVFSGHQHWSKRLKENGIDYYVVGSLTEDINGNGIPDGVYFEINLNGTALQAIEHHLKIEL